MKLFRSTFTVFTVKEIVITYSTELLGSQEDLQFLRKTLEYQRLAFNACSKQFFELESNSIVVLHAKFYKKFRESQPQTPSQVVICAQRNCLAAYKTVRSNHHRIAKPVEKKRLSMHLDKRLYSHAKCEFGEINITTIDKRKRFSMAMYPRLKVLMENFTHKDPLIFERDGKLMISMVFNVAKELITPKLALGVDLGMRIIAACSDGRLIVDKKFVKERRKLRFLKRQLQSKGSKSAKKHLRKLRRKEARKNCNQSHHVANKILETKADTIVLENLKGLKSKKFKFQKKNAISQVPFYELRRIITYKANDQGKSVVLVNPAFTSQTDSVTRKREGERRGRRFYSKTGRVYDADINAACNIAHKSKLPVSYGSILDGQGVINHPIACQSKRENLFSQLALQTPLLAAG